MDPFEVEFDTDESEGKARQASCSPPTSPSTWIKPTLDQFVYQGSHFPAVPPPITASSSSLDRTIDIVSALLDSTTNDLALFFMMDHTEILRLFEPRLRWDFARCRTVPVTYQIRGGDSRSAMAWYLFDLRVDPEPGARHGECHSCGDMDGLGPFRECFVPQVAEAMGACTNCLYTGDGARCSLRPDVEGVFAGFTEAMLEDATDEELANWVTRIRTELAHRELDDAVASRGGADGRRGA